MQTHNNSSKITEKQKGLLKEFVGNRCEECGAKSETLEVHRIQRGCQGGKYILRNVKIVCKKCHQLYHYNEF